MRTFCALLLGLLLLPLLLSGCADPYAGRKEVSGQILLNGQPIKEGVIDFEPIDGQDTKSGSMITLGLYRVPRKSGLKPGKYRVRITAGDGVTPVDPNQPPGPTNIVSRDLVPPEWNTRSDKDITVTASGPNTFDFKIP